MEAFETTIEKMELAETSADAIHVFLEELRRALIDNRLSPMGIDTICAILQDQEEAITNAILDADEEVTAKSSPEPDEDEDEDDGKGRTTATVTAKKTTVVAGKKK
jgi:hypothetical protein